MALTDDLIAYFKLDEASGNAEDIHSTNDLTDTNTVTNTTGKISGARQFTSANTEYFTLADNAAMSVSNADFTFAGWVYLDSVGVVHGLLSKWAAGTDREYYLRINADNTVDWIIGTGAATSNSVNATNFGALSVNTWYYIIADHDATGNTIGIS